MARQALSSAIGSRFPDGFVWGAAAASYQIEGAAKEDDRGLSVWDTFAAHPGAVLHGENGDVACDHYHRFRDDVAIMRQMKLQAYRFSISWSRVIPEGEGKVNPKGLAFYDALVDELLKNNVTPYCTLFHWDYPYDLYKRGGWLNRDSVKWFADYTRVIAERLGDRVKNWMTLNEPQCFVWLGHHQGIHAPGLKLPMRDVLTVAHHALMAHGASVQALRAHCKTKPIVGWAPVAVVSYPSTESQADIDAARNATLGTKNELWSNTWFSDPVCAGHYPEDGLKHFAPHLPKFSDDDMKLINQPLDFYGVNIYSGKEIRANAKGEGEYVAEKGDSPYTAIRWRVTPDALYWGVRFHAERYKLPIIVTENGLSSMDWVSLDGQVRDPNRIDYTTRYLRSLKRAIDENIDVRGYFHWSLMDNFEWAYGYQERFGLTFVDYPTQKRIIKDSGHWYAKVIESNGALIADQT
ncbi:MAG: beta-glucosidase [Anaerolineae bacterium]|nr:beta-glucosidase [Phycisphaerae bacterium]